MQSYSIVVLSLSHTSLILSEILLFVRLFFVGVVEALAAVTYGKWRILNHLLILQSQGMRCVVRGFATRFHDWGLAIRMSKRFV